MKHETRDLHLFEAPLKRLCYCYGSSQCAPCRDRKKTICTPPKDVPIRHMLNKDYNTEFQPGDVPADGATVFIHEDVAEYQAEQRKAKKPSYRGLVDLTPYDWDSREAKDAMRGIKAIHPAEWEAKVPISSQDPNDQIWIAANFTTIKAMAIRFNVSRRAIIAALAGDGRHITQAGVRAMERRLGITQHSPIEPPLAYKLIPLHIALQKQPTVSIPNDGKTYVVKKTDECFAPGSKAFTLALQNRWTYLTRQDPNDIKLLTYILQERKVLDHGRTRNGQPWEETLYWQKGNFYHIRSDMTGLGLSREQCKVIHRKPTKENWDKFWEVYGERHLQSNCTCSSRHAPCHWCEHGWKDNILWDYELYTNGICNPEEFNK